MFKMLERFAHRLRDGESTEAAAKPTGGKPTASNRHIIYHEFRWHLIIWALGPLVTAIGGVVFLLR